MISQTAEYALRAVVDLTFNAGEPRTTQEIAEATLVPIGYLSKVLKELGRAGIVSAQRGPNGGHTLLHDPEELSLYDVIAVIDPPMRIHECPLKLKSHRLHLCPLHKRLDDALALVERAFKETTIAEVTADPPKRPRRAATSELTISGGLAASKPNGSSKPNRKAPQRARVAQRNRG
ncbi:MAG: Rrf2 family transcriptional regulator [Phycisphaerales bacterium]|nr:MAG: Rrf2 family transcriptional regulator [Phycisphaerales bacterium]